MVYLIVAELVTSSLVLCSFTIHLDANHMLIILQGAFVNVAYFEQFGVTLIEVRTFIFQVPV
jgi:hypothetical protein